MKIYLEIYFKKPGKIMEIWNFVNPEKWEPCPIVHSDSLNIVWNLTVLTQVRNVKVSTHMYVECACATLTH